MRPPSRSAGVLAQLTSRCILDDRGRRVQVVRVSRWWPPPGHVLAPEVRTLVRPRITPWKGLRFHKFRALLMPIGVSICNAAVLIPAFLVYMALIRSVPGFPNGSAAIVLMLGWMAVVVAVSVTISMPFGRWYWNPLIVPAVLDTGHCASCGYSLMDRAAEPDGCRVCPECGAAWKTDEWAVS